MVPNDGAVPGYTSTAEEQVTHGFFEYFGADFVVTASVLESPFYRVEVAGVVRDEECPFETDESVEVLDYNQWAWDCCRLQIGVLLHALDQEVT